MNNPVMVPDYYPGYRRERMEQKDNERKPPEVIPFLASGPAEAWLPWDATVIHQWTNYGN